MKKICLWVLSTCFMLITSCSNEDLDNSNNTIRTLSATAENFGITSRAGFNMSNGASFFWNNGDAIGVGSESFGKYTTSCTDRSTSATFSGFSTGGYAVYPFSGARSINNNTLTYEFASTYNYGNNVDTDFFSDMSIDIPMWAQVVGSTLSFKHLGGLFAFKFPNLKAGDNQTFTLTANKRISGQFNVDLDTNAQINTEEATNENDKKVVITFSLQNDATAVFYVPVPVGNYDISIELKNKENKFTTAWNGLQVNRRDIRYTSLIANDLQGAEAKVVGTSSEVKEAMQNNTCVIVNNITSTTADSTVEIDIPKKSSNAESEHSLAINSIDTNTTTIKISESNNSGSSISKLVISVPTIADAKKLEINMPYTTVTIAVNGVGTMTLDEATASTSENTFIVDKNVIIKKLVVSKGNVRIKSGAVVNTIETSLSNKVKIYLEDGAILTNEPAAEKFEIISAASYDFLQFLEGNPTNGTYTLTGNVTIPANTDIPSGVTIDGGENKYSVSTTATGTEGIGKGVFILNENATIKNVTFVSPMTQYDIIVKGASTIEACNFSTATDASLGKGKRALYTGSESLSGTMTVTNCSFDDKVYAFNFSNAANQMDITFTGSTMKGWLSGHGKSHKFVNCIFGASGDYKNYIPYCTASFEGCTFSEDFTLSIKHASTLTFDANCKVGENLLTNPSQLKWDNSGDGNDNNTSETVNINTATWSNSETETANWEDTGLLTFLQNNPTAGSTYTLTGNVTIPANTDIPSGVTIDGGENKYSVSTTATGTEGIGKGVFILNKNATIKNVTFVSPMTQYDIIVKGASTIEACNFSTATDASLGKGKRALYTGSESLSGTMTVTNCSFDDKVYAFNFSNAANQMDITFTGSTMKGWLSGHGKSHKFVNCIFGTSGNYKNYIPYCTASFESCTFAEDFTISIKHASTFAFDGNCKVEEKLLTDPSQLKWDNSGDGKDNNSSETVTINSVTWSNSETENAKWEINK